jgi:hypothetical protein
VDGSQGNPEFCPLSSTNEIGKPLQLTCHPFTGRHCSRCRSAASQACAKTNTRTGKVLRTGSTGRKRISRVPLVVTSRRVPLPRAARRSTPVGPVVRKGLSPAAGRSIF